MADRLTRTLKGWKGPSRVVTPEQFGYKNDGSKATAAIQRAIDACAKQGGGTVRLSQGDYVSGTIDLRSGIRLEVAKGARLLGSTELADYPQRLAKRPTVMDSNMGMNQSLIFAIGCENISIAGQGLIDFRGTHENFPGEQTKVATPGRPFGIRILDCKNVHIKDITLKDAACWMQNYLNCDDVLVEGITVHNQANWNNDGLDIDSCRRVIVRNCLINAEDDALCFKGAGMLTTEEVLIENCRFYSSCNSLKFGTDSQGGFRKVLVRNIECGGIPEELRTFRRKFADSAISWETVDGCTLEDIYAHDIKIERCDSPLFLRLGDRGRTRPELPRPRPGEIRRVVFENISGQNNGSRGSYFIGVNDRRIEDVVLKNVDLKMRGTTESAPLESTIGELPADYPDTKMIGPLAPAFGLWTRHIERLTLINVRFSTEGPDKRPMLKVDTDSLGVTILS